MGLGGTLYNKKVV